MKNEQQLRQELNPFMPGAGMQPPELAGREKDMGDFILRTMPSDGQVYDGR